MGAQEEDRVASSACTVDSWEHTDTFDQVNLGSLASMEALCRSIQAIIDAYKVNANKPNFESSKYYSGLIGMQDGVSPALRAHVARRVRDDAEVEKERQQV